MLLSRILSALRRPHILIAPLALVLSACPKPCDVEQKVVAVVNLTIKPVMGLLVPTLAPQLAGQYQALVAAYDGASAALGHACDKNAAGEPAVAAALQAATDLIAWYQAHKPTRDQAERAISRAGLPAARDLGDPEAALRQAAGVDADRAPDIDEALRLLAQARGK